MGDTNIVLVIIYTGIVGLLLYLSMIMYLLYKSNFVRPNVVTKFNEIEDQLVRYVGTNKCNEILNTSLVLKLNYSAIGVPGYTSVSITLDKTTGAIGVTYKLDSRQWVISTFLLSTEVNYLERKLLEFKDKHEIWRNNEEVIRRNKF